MYKPLRHSNTDECIRDDLRTPEIQNFPGGAYPQTPQSSKVHESPTWGTKNKKKTKTNRMIHNRQSKLLKKFPELVHKKDVHVHKERKQLICRVEVEANFSMVCT